MGNTWIENIGLDARKTVFWKDLQKHIQFPNDPCDNYSVEIRRASVLTGF